MIYNIKLLLTVLLTALARTSLSQGCTFNKDFKRASELSRNPDTAPYIDAFFDNQTCFIHPDIHDMRECYVYCNSGLDSCVAFAPVGSDCYICDKNVNAASVPQNLQSRFMIWKAHLFTLDPCTSEPCDQGNCTKMPGGFLCIMEENDASDSVSGSYADNTNDQIDSPVSSSVSSGYSTTTPTNGSGNLNASGNNTGESFGAPGSSSIASGSSNTGTSNASGNSNASVNSTPEPSYASGNLDASDTNTDELSDAAESPISSEDNYNEQSNESEE